MFILTTLLLKYHNPRVSNYFTKHNISPEVYSTPWLLTMYATKTTSSDLIFMLWEEILSQNDTIFPCYVAVAILDNENFSFSDSEYGMVPVHLNRMKITSEAQMKEIIDKSKKLKRIVPVSVSTKLKQYDIFDLKRIESYVEVLKENTCLSIQPREIMQLVYPEYKICTCEVKCESCNISYPVIIIDCRSEKAQSHGNFPNTEFLKEIYYENLETFTNQFEGIKGVYHFALMDFDKDSSLVPSLAKLLIEKEFPYVSIIEGGYFSCHQLAMLFKLPINNHVPSNCSICKEQNKIKVTKPVDKPSFINQIENIEQHAVYECLIYEKGKLNKNRKFDLILTKNEILVYETNTGFNKKFPLIELVKISTSNDSSKVIEFHFSSSKEKFMFSNKSLAKQCIKDVSSIIKNLENQLDP